MEYSCPDKIARLFDRQATVAKGRARAFEWAKGLDLKIGDKVWLPEIGWQEKTETSVQ